MSFAAFILKLEADTRGVNAGVNTAIGHFKRLGASVKDIEKRKDEMAKKAREEAKQAFERLKPEDRLNQLLRTREQIVQRIDRVDNPKIKNAYLQKQVELEKQIATAKKEQADAGRKGAIRSVAEFALGGGVIGLGARAGIGDAANIEAEALKAGLSPEAIQRLQFGANATGGDFRQILNTFLDVQKNRSGALMGDKEQIKSFSRLGYSTGDLAGMSPEQLFFDLSNKVQNGEINEGNIAAFFKVAEQGAKEVLPAMKRGLDDAARGFGGLASSTNPVIAQLAEVHAAFVRIAATVKSTGAGFLRNTTAGALSLAKGGAAALLNIPAMLGSDTAAAARDSLLTEREQMWGDGDIDLTGALEAAKKRRELRDADARKSAEEEAKSYFEHYNAFIAPDADTKRRNRKESFSQVDTDSLARIGLFRGANETKKFQEDILRLVRDMQRDIEDIRKESEE